MDQNEFSRRLRQLAGVGRHPAERSSGEYNRILGSLGLAMTVRRVQALALCLVLGWGAVVILHATDLSLPATGGVALLLAAAGTYGVRRFPYWTPAGALRSGLIALSTYPLNDLGSFIKNQRTDLTVVNNTLLSDLCMQLAMDRRRPAIEECS